MCFLWAGAVSGNEASFMVEVPERESKVARLRSLPKDVKIEFVVTSARPIVVALVAQGDLNFRTGAYNAVFKGRVDRSLTFGVTIPKSDHYLVVLDNRSGDQVVSVTVGVKAHTSGMPEPKPSSSVGAGGLDRAEAEKVQAFLERLGLQLRQVFEFEPIPFQVRSCGEAAAVATRRGIVLCTEAAKALKAKLGDPRKVSDALLFTIFHELGHLLLAQWQSPVYANEEVADEFATVVLVMLDQRDRIKAIVEYFAAEPTLRELMAKHQHDDRHPLSMQRARNIQNWLGEPGLVRRWQPLLVPHLTTPALEKLVERPPLWADSALLRQQLVERRDGVR